MAYTQVHVSEVPDSPVVECTWATGLELARAALYGTEKEPPATPAEREALRIAGGGSDTSGANYEQLAHGCQSRYGWSPAVGASLVRPAPGVFLGVQGNMHAVPDHYKRWDPHFGSLPVAAHSLVVYNLSGAIMWCDPLAPAVVNGKPWQGEPVSWGVVEAYFAALPGARVATARVNVPPNGYALLIPAGATVEHAPANGKGQIALPWQEDVWGSSPSSAPCTAATTRPTTVPGVTATVVRVLAGKYGGQWVHMNGQVRVAPR